MSRETAEFQTGGNLRIYVRVWLSLIALTAVQVIVVYLQSVSFKGTAIVLMALTILKSWLIASFFMHLRTERRSFVLALFPSVILTMLLLFAFFPDSLRLLQLKVP